MNRNSIENKKIRKFGLIAFVFFGLLCSIGVWQNKLLPVYLFGLLSLVGLGFIISPSLMKPLYTAWLKIAHFIGKSISILMLTLVFYLVITPTALIMRLLRVNPLRPKTNQKSSTYWITRQEPLQPKERFFNRY